MSKNILHLTLKKKWFYMIQSGQKKEEYREIKDYWVDEWQDIDVYISELGGIIDNSSEAGGRTNKGEGYGT